MSLLKHMERWRNIEGYEGLYQISNCGRVKSLNYNRTGKEKILNSYKNSNRYDYLCIKLCKEGKIKHFFIHRLVATAFLPNPNNLQEVNHKNEIKTDNYVSNLEWCTREYNCNYGTRNEKFSKKVICIETNQVYESTIEAERQTKVFHSNISQCCLGKRKTTSGFHWKFVE